MPNRTARPAVARSLGDGRIGIWVHFDDKDEAKALPGARWDRSLKCWTVPATSRADADALVARLNARTGRQPGSTDAIALTDAFARVLAALAPPLRRPVHRALAQVLHPDRGGGDDDAMRALNDAWNGGAR